MARFGNEPFYLDVFEKNYLTLVRGLPAGLMWDDFVAKGLVRDVTLRQQILADPTDSGKMRKLLEAIRKGVSIGSNNSFMKLLDAMKEYGTFAKDQTVVDLAVKIRQELPDGMCLYYSIMMLRQSSAAIAVSVLCCLQLVYPSVAASQ